jgi:hypothetical protein
MKNIIRVEEAAMFGLAVLMFAETNFLWWLFLVFLLVPDISMLGYLFSSKIGAFMYNLFHHKGIAIFIYFLGYVAEERYLELAGAILFGHSSLDRIFGYGLKFTDNFKHTHLGRIGEK